jgi:hypothetical protein
VFQSTNQKLEFLEKWDAFVEGAIGESMDTLKKFQIINGLKLAKALGIDLKEETTKDYPTGNLDLAPYVLDDYSME